MKNNMDESDYEDESFNNEDTDESITQREAFTSFFNTDSDKRLGKKRSHSTLTNDTSDLNDSDYNDDSYHESINDRNNKKFKSDNMYQAFSEQESTYESGSQSTHNDSIEDSLKCDNEVGKSRMKRKVCEDSYVHNKRTNRNKKSKINQDTTDEETDYNPKEKLIKLESKNVPDGEDKIQRMMRIMGYKEGHGLGKNKQGRLEPVQASKQHGRRGLGHHIPGIEASSLKWDPAKEEIKVVEDMDWIKNSHVNLPTVDEMQHWIQKGPKKLTIDDETIFCHKDIVKNLLNSKNVLDHLDEHEILRAKTHCNPYETIRGAIFLNRAAVKMANIDKACDFMFTKTESLEKNELLYFADVCAGPGGFSEYVLWKKKWHAKGFGLTLKNENDFKLADFYAGPCETFHPYYGPKDNGDVFDPSNQEGFRDLIMTHTYGKGVHFMMSDGGFSVEGQHNIQEILSKQLYLCQCLVALMIVRVGGHFVTKLFDLFTPFSAGLVYLMYRCFEEICIFKPNSSRPANSERYLICKNKRPGTEDILRYLTHVNHILLKGDVDVLELVSLEELKREKQFFRYLCESNEYLGRKQIISLCKIIAFYEDNTLVETKQGDMRRECLDYWEIPDESRTIPRHMKPKDKLNQLLGGSSKFLLSAPKELTADNIESTILKQPYDWFCMPSATGPNYETKRNATFYLGMGRSNVYRYIKNTWVQVDDINIELPADTLLYAEVVYEMTKEFKHQQKVFALHILDAFMLGGENVSQKYIKQRHESAKKFCEALRKPMGSRYDQIRVKELLPLNCDICEKLQLTQRIMKNKSRPVLVYELPESSSDYNNPDNDRPYFIPSSIIFFKSTASPWNRYISKTHSVTYVFNYKTGENKYDNDRPSSAEANFTESFENRIIWNWPNNESFSMESFTQFIKQKCPERMTLEY